MIRTFFTICTGLAFIIVTGTWLDMAATRPAIKLASSQNLTNPYQTASENKLWRVSAYCPCEKCCYPFADGITASGEPAKGFFVAAPPEIPFYTRLTIPGYNDGLPVPVLDRGGAIQGNKIDIFYETHQEALNWGVQWLKVRFEK